MCKCMYPLSCVQYRIVHWTTRSTVTTVLYGLPINHDQYDRPTINVYRPRSSFRITSFAEDVLSNCIFLADRNGNIQYLPLILPLGVGGMSNCSGNSDNCEEILNFKLYPVLL